MEKEVTKAASPLEVTPRKAPHEPRNYLAAFLLTALGGYFGLRHFYLGSPKLGWLRTGLFIGGYATLIIMLALNQAILAFIGALAVMAAGIWAVIDFFYVFFVVKTDAEGKPLTVTIRDKKWAKLIFWLTIGSMALITAGYIVMLVLIENNPSLYDPSFEGTPRSGETFLPDDNDTVY